jgi:hypothetical protein
VKRLAFCMAVGLLLVVGASGRVQAQRVVVNQAVISNGGTPVLSAVSSRIISAIAANAAIPMPATTPPPSVTLTWTASSSTSVCSPSGTPACTVGYNVLRGTAPGAESATPLNSTPLTGLTYQDTSVALPAGAAPVAYYYVVEAVETVGSVTGNPSAPSNEVSGTFPGTPAAPGTVSAVAVN